jgi:predicted  nucleic acid-binding Zn-ribbon protein
MARRTMISQLASAGEEALGQLAQNPVTRKALEGAMQVKERVEKLVSGLADIDGRVSRIEKRLEALEKAKRATTRARKTVSKTSSAKTKSSS